MMSWIRHAMMREIALACSRRGSVCSRHGSLWQPCLRPRNKRAISPRHRDHCPPVHALAMYVIVAWRIPTITMVGRAYPEVSCAVVFAPREWHTL